MPNWCNNHVIIEGKKDEILELIDIASKGNNEDNVKNVFSFDNVFPTPEEALKDNNDGWYQWRINNWGTKWDIEQHADMLSDVESGGVDGNMVFELYYETAWSPAVAFWENVAKKFSSLKVTNEFFEEGNCFIGYAFICEGQIIEDVSRAIHPRDYIEAGAVLDEDNDVDWEASEDFDMWKLFPIES